MKKFLKSVAVGVLIISVTACSTVPKVNLADSNKEKIKTIAIVEIEEPEKYNYYPEQMPGGYLLYMFGALGGAVLGTIEVARQNQASNEFTSALVNDHSPAVASLWNTQLSKSLTEKGYEVTALKPIKQTDDTEKDCKEISNTYDAVLFSEVNAAYTEFGGIAPQVVVQSKLYDGQCKETYYTESFMYRNSPMDGFTYIESAPEYQFSDKTAMYSHIETAQKGIQTGVSKIVDQLVTEF